MADKKSDANKKPAPTELKDKDLDKAAGGSAAGGLQTGKKKQY